MNLQDIGLIINFTILFIAYGISSTLSGWFRALVARSMGDDTAARLGYLSLNPGMHIDLIGLIFLLSFGYGWGKYVPINNDNISYPYRIMKCIFAFLADTFMLLVIAITSLTLLLRLFGVDIIYILLPMIYTGSVYLPAFNTIYPEYSSLYVVIALILAGIIYISVMLVPVKFIASSVDLTIMHLWPDLYQQGYIVFLVSMIVLCILFYPLREYVLYMIEYASYFLANTIGGQ